jgi:alkanesulfonate monooxygenase SsuD/methylene tetrahydromethanopterin reductase-like flavin-dependent oxidoreductase (luciferase family)
VFLAACSQRTRNIRLGHGIRQVIPGYNHPARTAEVIATLDLVSNGRVDFGTGESSAILELGGFGVDVETKRRAYLEATEQICNMLAMDPYPGFEGEFFSMPCRNVVPKPLQRPHPPLWVACSNRDTIKMAAENGMGVLCFSFQDPADAKHWVDEYYDIIRSERCVPIGHAVNANIAMVTSFSVHRDKEEAIRRGKPGFDFFRYALANLYIFGEHVPGRTNIWEAFEKDQANPALSVLPDDGQLGGIGTPEDQRAHLEGFERSGVDQVIFIQQAGQNRHEHICESLELFANEVMPGFAERSPAREKRKQEELAPYLEAAMERKRFMKQLADEDIPKFEALGRQIIASAQEQ